VGGLGSPAAMYLAASGVGTLTLVDFDRVDNSNLQRQIIHNTRSLGINKAESAKQTLLSLNPETKVRCIDDKLTPDELDSLVANASCVIDATDNFTSRFMINRACVAQHTALVSAAAIQYEGQISVFDLRHKNSACYACLYAEDQTGAEEENTSCSDNGILAPVVGILGSMQALEAIKLICNIGNTLQNRLLIFDALALQWRTMKLNKDPNCTVCS
jgi:adenylyltransferase/sulfurtransferase